MLLTFNLYNHIQGFTFIFIYFHLEGNMGIVHHETGEKKLHTVVFNY